MNSFINRDSELNSLESLYRLPGSQLVVVYGRRRLGKTSLLREFSRGKSAIYYMADKAGEVSQRAGLARAMAESLDEPTLGQVQYDSWYDLFAAFDRVRPSGQKLILMFDEYQYLCQTQPAFSSYMQKWWDEHWRDGNIFLVLCGSLTSMMYRETLAHSSPLYGRCTGQLLLKPFPYRHVRDFVTNPGERTCVERYALCGGVPRYLELMSPYRDFMTGLREGILSPAAPLHNEARYLLQDEIDVPNTCWSLLEAMASGAHRISELASRLQLPANQLTRYVSLLRDLSIVDREVPVLERNPSKSKRGLYVITDPFLRLWFGDLYPYESFFEIGTTDAILERLQPRLERHIALCYEQLCRDYIRHRLVRDGATVRIGRQWGAHYEMDIAGVNTADELTVLGECKWSTYKVGLSILTSLQSAAEGHKLPLADDIQWLLFSRSGFTKELQQHAESTPNIKLIDRIFDT